MAIPVAFVIDVEYRGDDAMRNGIVSIGVCVGRTDRLAVLETRRFDLKPMVYTEYLQLEKMANLRNATATWEEGVGILTNLQVHTDV